MTNKIIFLKITWMRSYKGFSNDSSYGGGQFIKEHGWGHELFNFSAKNGICYGNKSGSKNIDINKLGASDDDDRIKNVTVVFTAPNKLGGVYIVGWYKNATLFRHHKNQPRTFRGHRLEYFAECKSSDAKLLPEDERTLTIPTGKNGMGQANVWYAENQRKFLKKVNDLIFKGISQIKIKKTTKSIPFQVDSIKRKKVENAAIKNIYNYYTSLGYKIKSVENEKTGWDLEAIKGKIKLLLEVKGLSGNEINIELTANEYKQLDTFKKDYRLCIVTSVLNNPKRFIFSYSIEQGNWNDDVQNKSLSFKTIISARVTA